jgi:hypothetical protein
MWHVDISLVRDWLLELDLDTYEKVVAAIQALRDRGPTLGRPLVDSVSGSRHSNMKELRPGSAKRSEIRILFAFDPERRAILLVAGDKSGSWNKWYKRNIGVADDLFDRHLEFVRTKRHDQS